MVHVHAHNNLQDASLAVLAHRIRQKQEIINDYTRNALRVALHGACSLCLSREPEAGCEVIKPISLEGVGCVAVQVAS